jgi:hypothetical protein
LTLVISVQRFNLQYDEPLSDFAFKFNLRLYTKASVFGHYAYIDGTNFGPVGAQSYIAATLQNGTGNSFTCVSPVGRGRLTR